MYAVEVNCSGDGVAAPMASMRTWLDHNGIRPTLFELSFLPHRHVRFRVQFETLNDAAAFAQAFEGEVANALETGAVAA